MNDEFASESHLSPLLAAVCSSIADDTLDADAIERVRQKALAVSASAKETSPANLGVNNLHRHRRAWGIGLAASVLICSGVAIGIVGNETSAFAEVIEALSRVKTASYVVTQQVDGNVSDTTKVWVLDGVYRAERANGSVVLFSPKQKQMLTLDLASKTGTLYEGATLQDGFDILSVFADLGRYAKKSEIKVVEKEIDGMRAKGLVVDVAGIAYIAWINPQSNLPLQLVLERKQAAVKKDESREPWRIAPLPVSANGDENVFKETWSAFRFNESFDASLFDMSVEGYTIVKHHLDGENGAENQKKRLEEVMRKATLNE